MMSLAGSMLFHNKYTISLSRVSLMLESDNINLVKRVPIWLPKPLVYKAYASIISEIAKLMSVKENEGKLNDHLLMLQLYNRINSLLPALYYGLSISKKPSQEMISYFEDHYGKKPIVKEDLNLILDDIKRLTAKYNELNVKQPVAENEPSKLNFEKLLLGIELTLDNGQLPRETKLYQLQSYYEAATEKIRKQNEQINRMKARTH